MNHFSMTFSSLQTMKKLAVCAVLAFLCAGANAQSNTFDELAKIKGVEYQHVDKDMINLAAKQGNGLHVGEVVNLGGGDDGGKFLDQFDDVKVFTCEKEGNIKKFQKAALKLLKGKEWEPLVDTKGDDGEMVKIYLSKKDEQSTNVVLAVEEGEATLVVINGTFDISKMLHQGMKMNVEVNN